MQGPPLRARTAHPCYPYHRGKRIAYYGDHASAAVGWLVADQSDTVSNMLFVSCPNWGTNPNNYGTYDICPHAAQTNNNGNMQSYAEYLGSPNYSVQNTLVQDSFDV